MQANSVLAEGVGFEPTRKRKPPGGFQDRCLKPLGHPSTGTWSADRWTANAERTRARASRRKQGQVLQRAEPYYLIAFLLHAGALFRLPQHAEDLGELRAHRQGQRLARPEP